MVDEKIITFNTEPPHIRKTTIYLFDKTTKRLTTQAERTSIKKFRKLLRFENILSTYPNLFTTQKGFVMYEADCASFMVATRWNLLCKSKFLINQTG